jgi:hypothetical protein
MKGGAMRPRSLRGFLTSTFLVLVLLVGLTATCQAQPTNLGPTRTGEWRATLATKAGDKGIFDWQLRDLIRRFIGSNYYSKIIAFTECFGGDAAAVFPDARNTTIMTAADAGELSYYGGYHYEFAKALLPGSTTDAVHETASNNNKFKGVEHPTIKGPNQSIGVGGDIHSCHVLVWAGNPEDLDWNDIDHIRHNFAGRLNTTVTVLAGDWTSPPDRLPPDGAATFASLRETLRKIGKQMAPDEQFILVVTDHGNLAPVQKELAMPTNVPVNVIMGFNPHIYDVIKGDPASHPYLAIFTQLDAPPIPPGTLTVSFNGLGPYTVGQNVEQTDLDYDGDGVADQYEYDIPVDKATLLEGDNSVVLYNSGPADLTLHSVGLDSGAIQRLGDGNPGSSVP